MEVTLSKQWIHFLLSERWPPTSTILTTTPVTHVLGLQDLSRFPYSVDELPEDYFGKVEGVFYDARSGDPDPQHVLQGGHVGHGRDSVQVVQVTGRRTPL